MAKVIFNSHGANLVHEHASLGLHGPMKFIMKAGEMPQQLTMPAAESDNSGSIPGFHMVEEQRTSSHNCPLTFTSALQLTCMLAYIHKINTKKILKIYFDFQHMGVLPVRVCAPQAYSI